MQAGSNEIISVPSIDIPYYFKNILAFLVDSYPSSCYFINSLKCWIIPI